MIKWIFNWRKKRQERLYTEAFDRELAMRKFYNEEG